MLRVFSFVALVIGLFGAALTYAPVSLAFPGVHQDAVLGLAGPAELVVTAASDRQPGLDCVAGKADDDKSGCQGKTLVATSVPTVSGFVGEQPQRILTAVTVQTATVATTYRPPRLA